MKHFLFSEIKQRGDCKQFIEQILNIPVVNNRCVARWRNGERDSVSVSSDKWFDHATSEGGGIIELCAITKFGGLTTDAIQEAQQFLGEWLHLEEVKFRKTEENKSRYSELISEGYVEKARYNYIDLDGKLQYFVCRLEHPEKKKEFVQGTPDHWGIKNVKMILYNLAEINCSSWCVIVEGEKDVETLKRFHIPATTNSGGAKKWQDDFQQYFLGKDVVIIEDNDAAGEEHAEIIAESILPSAKSVKVLKVSTLEKGDVTDYFEKEGGTLENLMMKIKNAPLYKQKNNEIQAAKKANREPFRNFTLIHDEEENKTKKIPRTINELVKDIHVRLLNAPFRVGNELFDKDLDSGQICYMYNESDLFSWIQRKTNNYVEWAKTEGCVTKQEFFSALKSEAKQYSSISYVPDFPVRDDVFYCHEELPEASANHEYFETFISFFNPVDEVNKAMLRAFVMQPLYYTPLMPRPMWIIDSPTGQGSGKSKIPELVSILYGSNNADGQIIDISINDLNNNYSEVVKRIISTSGRNSRILRLDNVTGVLKSSQLASLVTASAITGRPAYGKGEESRPNNLMYVVTVNGASVDTDIASRAYYLNVAKPLMKSNWNDDVLNYIQKNRYYIFQDIIDIIKSHVPFGIPPSTRFPKFEEKILQPACGSLEMFQNALNMIHGEREESNTDEELAKRIEEELFSEILKVKPSYSRSKLNPLTDRIFIRSNVLEKWFSRVAWIDSRQITEQIRGLAKTGMLKCIDPNIRRFPNNDGIFKRRSGIMLNAKNHTNNETRVISLEEDGTVEILQG